MDIDGSAWRSLLNVGRVAVVPVALLGLGVVPVAAQTAAIVDTTRTSASASFPDGMRVLDSRGGEIAEVRHRIAGADGAIRQVLVRTGGVAGVRSSLKALPAATLVPQGDAVVAPLTRLELQTLPDAEPPEPVQDAPPTAPISTE